MKKLIFLFTLMLTSPAFAAQILVDTNWLAKNLNKDGIVVVDTSDQTQHMRFHIPGAVPIDYNEIVYQPRGKKFSVQVPNKYFMKLLGKKGISNNDHIVIYDDMGGMHAGRLFWQLEQIGHKKISVVNGGLVKWILEGRKITNKETKIKPASYNENSSGHKDNLATTESFKNSKALLIDARSKEEYIGYPRYPRTGHIPGAKLWDWSDNVDFENAFTIKSEKHILAQQSKIDLSDKNQEIVTYCRSGHRAAQTYLTLRNMGFNNIKLYDGSMAEYSQNKKLPLEKGCTGC